MTVAQVTLTLDVGGLEHLVIQLAERLQRRGIRSPIVALAGGAMVEHARARGIETFTLGHGEGFSPATVWRLRQLIRREGIHLLHTHNFSPLIYGALAGALTGTTVINTRHGRAALTASPLMWRMVKGVVAVSEDARRELVKHNTIPGERLRVILNGIDLDPHHAAGETNILRRELGIDPATPTIGIVARLSPEKDHCTLLQAFQLLVASGTNAQLVIVGDGPLKGTLQALAAELGIADIVHFVGFRTDVASLLRGLDVFVLSSLMEGVSLTLLEAMAAGRPVVATNVGGNPEVVLHEETGLLVEPGDPAGLSRALARLLSDARLRHAYGEAGRDRAQRLFSVDRMVDAYLALYSEVLGPRAATRAWQPASADR